MISYDLNAIKNRIDNSKLLIFDFDGVILDSVEVKTIAFAELYKQYGKSVVDKVVLHHRANGGMSRYDKFKYYQNYIIKNDNDLIDIQTLSDRFSKLVFDKVVSSSEIKSSILFLKLNCSKKICVINSATPQNELIKITNKRKIGCYFRKILGSPKTKCENISIILSQYNCSNDKVLFFGDSRSDLNASIASNITFIGVGEGIIPLLKKSDKLHYHIKDFSQIIGN